jgi:hypothetical protein
MRKPGIGNLTALYAYSTYKLTAYSSRIVAVWARIKNWQNLIPAHRIERWISKISKSRWLPIRQ